MRKAKLTREELEDQEDIDYHTNVMNDPNTKWVDWRKLDAELKSDRQREGGEVDQKLAKVTTGTDQGKD